jgi:hypothetical protein
MSFASKHNKSTVNLFHFQQEEGVPWTKLQELYQHGYTSEEKAVVCLGLYINRSGRYEPYPVMICQGFNVNLPSHMVSDVEEILSSQEDIDAINNATVGAYVYEYTNKRGGKSYSLRWVDIPTATLPY